MPVSCMSPVSSPLGPPSGKFQTQVGSWDPGSGEGWGPGAVQTQGSARAPAPHPRQPPHCLWGSVKLPGVPGYSPV